MANALIKVNIVIYQIVSTFLLLYILSSMIYYTYIQRKKSLFVKNQKNIVPICYDIYNNNHTYIENKFIYSTHQCVNEGYIITQKPFDQDELTTYLNHNNINNLLIFDTYKAAEEFYNNISMMLSKNNGIVNIGILMMIVLFFFSMKMTMLIKAKNSLKEISTKKNKTNLIISDLLHTNKIKEDKKIFTLKNVYVFYDSVIFELTLLVIIPSLYYQLSEFEINDFFMCKRFSLFAVLLNRLNISKSYITLKKYKDIVDYTSPPKINPYCINMLFLSTFVWFSDYFNLFKSDNDKKSAARSHIVEKKRKKIAKILLFMLFLSFWVFFLFNGILYVVDFAKMYHLIIYKDFSLLSHYKISIFILTLYYHIFYYISMIIFTFYSNKN